MPDTLKFVKNDSGYLAIYAIQIPEIETHGQIVAADTIVIVTSYLLQGTMSQTWIRNK